ncbi:tRNA (adenine(22)-N(1))-methyltransferase TrmK [Neobacillus drentensis]|uniref:tRNA (adenine(22)-N(1))-methyltransferase n=1 Tax=Neobacillus drentensis TaxID=220684 RepID=UPI002FFDAD5D
MNTDKLSVRLKTVAKYVIEGARMADIGSDHAYLPCYLAKKSKISYAVAGEVAQGPFQSAEKNVLSEGLADTIAVRMGDGLAVIEPDEVDCITIAGMGGALISSILDNGKGKLDSVQRLILQPNISAISIRTWLLANNWELIAEEIIEEDSKIYEILVAERGDPSKPYQKKRDEGLLLGPFLLEQKNEIFKKKWTAEMKNWQRISEALEGASETAETIEKRKELICKINLVKEVLK